MMNSFQGLIYHLNMVLNDGCNVFDELGKIVYKYINNPYVKINKDEILQRYTQQTNKELILNFSNFVLYNEE